MSQIYHPTGDDPMLVQEYTNLMNKASMVNDYDTFRKNHWAKKLFITGKEDEFFCWQGATGIL